MRAEGHSEMLARPREREGAQSDNTRRQIVKKNPRVMKLERSGDIVVVTKGQRRDSVLCHQYTAPDDL